MPGFLILLYHLRHYFSQLPLLTDWQHSWRATCEKRIHNIFLYFFLRIHYCICDIGGAAAFHSRFSCIKAFSFCHWSKSSRAQGKPPSCDGGGSLQLLSRSIYTRYIGCSSVTPLPTLSTVQSCTRHNKILKDNPLKPGYYLGLD